MTVAEILALLPTSEGLLAEYGLHCFHCAFNVSETLEEGYLSHGFMEDQLEDLVRDLNEMLRTQPKRPPTLTLTKDAAHALGEILHAEGKTDGVLQVGLDEHGTFCLEFRELPAPESSVFFHREVPEVRIHASALTLSRIGGATIDLRDGRFKLDLPEHTKTPHACACGGKGTCAC
jgi:hypothetical protein